LDRGGVLAEVPLEIAEGEERLGVVRRELRRSQKVGARALDVTERSAREAAPEVRIRVGARDAHGPIEGVEGRLVATAATPEPAEVDPRVVRAVVELSGPQIIVLGTVEPS